MSKGRRELLGVGLFGVVIAAVAIALAIWVDWFAGIAVGILAITIMVIALRGFKLERLLSQIDKYLEPGETILAQLNVKYSGPGYGLAEVLVLTELRLYAFELHLKPQPPVVRSAYTNLMSVRMLPGDKPVTMRIELPDRNLEVFGMSRPELRRFEEVLNQKRPGLVVGTLSEGFLGPLR